MAATVSAWSKPGAWALDSEEHEAELLQNNNNNNNNNNVVESKPLAEFPSLAVAAATKPKKKKAQTLSLAEFTAKPVSSFTHQDPVDLPTGPRQRTAEELERDRSRIGGGFGSYGGGRPNRNSESDESSVSRWGSSRVSRNDSFGSRDRDSNRDSQPSRADEIDNWAAAKKPSFGNGSDRRDRVERGGGFFDSQSRADESDSWVTNKNFVPTEGRRFGGGGDRERRVGFGTSGGADSDNWNKKKVGEFSVASERTENVVVGGRPRLVLQPRSAPPSNENQDVPTAAAVVVAKPKGANPFGEARPREQVLAEKGQDWKKIDEQLETMKIKETTVVEGFGKRGFGSGNGRGEDRSERSWRKSTPSDDGRSESAEKVEDEHIEEN
ncbi:eukaryotic translation initiation factor 4B3 [Trifolium repens]|nr:eukaryotic translation initiation factor 4B3 [Trifolium repens]